MKNSLKPGIAHELRFRVPVTKTVPHLYPEAPEFHVMPRVRRVDVDGRKLVFEVEASDGADVISRGTHERFVIDADRFLRKLAAKAASAGPES